MLEEVSTPGQTQTDWGQGFILLLPQMAALPESDAGSGVISQHRVLSSKTVRPRAPCGAQYIEHTVRTWSAVCSEAPHSQFNEGARPHLCMHEWVVYDVSNSHSIL